jgi:hypothetical protein
MAGRAKGYEMKMKITTTYHFVDDEWLKWWIETNGPAYRIYSLDQLPHTLANSDPTSDVKGVTTIEVFDDEQLPPISL